jgi:sugar lactone lactonase YvrE
MIEQIEVPVQPTNMCFAGEELRTLLITARGSVFAVQMRVQGLERYAAEGSVPCRRRSWLPQ